MLRRIALVTCVLAVVAQAIFQHDIHIPNYIRIHKRRSSKAGADTGPARREPLALNTTS